ncbi:hypothetical protein QBC47DRAFT_74152 [Echria macrotheca]|uniref:Uncharacterized protein n=1 Tax=Echria macrotheca TaxID=438768 RepID=A0AAJ0B4S5_9PEZI|nr:hypothetical protein QBC47DRAFT_74152 [Echria macrotheca]
MQKMVDIWEPILPRQQCWGRSDRRPKPWKAQLPPDLPASETSTLRLIMILAASGSGTPPSSLFPPFLQRPGLICYPTLSLRPHTDLNTLRTGERHGVWLWRRHMGTRCSFFGTYCRRMTQNVIIKREGRETDVVPTYLFGHTQSDHWLASMPVPSFSSLGLVPIVPLSFPGPKPRFRSLGGMMLSGTWLEKKRNVKCFLGPSPWISLGY